MGEKNWPGARAGKESGGLGRGLCELWSSVAASILQNLDPNFQDKASIKKKSTTYCFNHGRGTYMP